MSVAESAELRFDGRVAIVTGGGRGLGRAYAELLAARGARVVVNDPGVSMKGDGTTEDPAQDTVDAIRAAGGEAVANKDSVATEAGGKAIVQAALDAFGRIDILVHNAGNVRKSPLREMSHEDWHAVIDVHMHGAFNVVRPAFPLMCDAGYGRIILTASINGLYGNANVVNYSTAKAAMIGLSNVIAIEGAPHDVKSNLIIPAAVTRMSEGVDTSAFPPMEPDMVAPAVGYLAHESCEMTGEMLVAMGGRIARAYVAETPGVYHSDWSIEQVAREIATIRDTSDPVVFAPVPTGQLDHLRYGFAMITAARG
jgi:NAD(P)-dependent dehydrogenase (short-subunit alcohol dehydrogenase family)